jgi:hypothetical protein
LISFQQLSSEDLRSDPILVRKIQRMQRAELEESQMDSDGDDDDDDDVEGPQSSHINEHDDSMLQVPSTQQSPQSSIIEDLGDPRDEDNEE